MYYWHWWRHILKRPATTGFPTERDRSGAGQANSAAVRAVEKLPAASRPLRRSLALRHLDAGSCNGCESELAMLVSPDWDFSRYGFMYTPSPKHADALVVTGVVTSAMAAVIEEVYTAMPAPKWVVAVGDCALGQGTLAAIAGGAARLSERVPVAAAVAGCPPTPADILRALLWVVDGKDPAAGILGECPREEAGQ